MKKQILFILLVWFLCHITALSTAQQKNQDQKISISVVNEPLSQVFDRLSRNTGITFSYNPDHIEASRLITISLKDKTIDEIISAILPAAIFGFRHSGNQLIVFRKETYEKVPSSRETIPDKPEKVGILKVKPDTVLITQTNVIRDTIAVSDTIVKYDTVYMMRTVLEKSPVSGNEIFSHQTDLSKEQTRRLKAEAGFSLNWMGTSPFYKASSQFDKKVDEYNNFNTGSGFSGNISLDFNLNYARLSFTSGLSYTIFNSKFKYNYDVLTGGYFLKDTLDKYYTLSGVDTTWYYVEDSVYLPVNTEAFAFNSTVSHKYFEIPLFLRYNHPVGRILIYAKAGIIAGFHSGSSGYFIKPDDDGIIKPEEVIFKPVVWSYALGMGILFPLSDRFTMESGLTYRRSFTTILDDFPVEIINRAFGIRAGIVYKF